MLLESLVYAFESNAKKLRDDVDGAKKSTDALGSSMKRADAAGLAMIRNMGAGLRGLIAGMAAGVSAAVVLRGAMARATDLTALDNLANTLGTTVQKLDAVRQAAGSAGADVGVFTSQLTAFADRVGKAMNDANSQQGKLFKSLGINLKTARGQARDTVAILADVTKSIEGMNRAQAATRLRELGITDPKSIELLIRGRKEFERNVKAAREASTVTRENVERARALDTAYTRLNNITATLGSRLSDSLIPALTRGSEWLSEFLEWTDKNRQTVTAFFTAVSAIVLLRYVPAMWAAARATLAATWPFLLVAGLVLAVAAAFALAYDDIQNFIEGNDSLIGQIIEKYPAVAEWVNALAKIWRDFGAALSWVTGEAMANTSGMADSMIATLTTLGSWTKTILDGIVSAFKSVVDFVGGAIDMIVGGAKDVAAFFGVTIGSDAPAAPEPRFPGMDILDDATAAQYNSRFMASEVPGVSQETNVQIGEINVQTQATDAEGVAQGIRDPLADAIRSAQDDIATGIDR